MLHWNDHRDRICLVRFSLEALCQLIQTRDYTLVYIVPQDR